MLFANQSDSNFSWRNSWTPAALAILAFAVQWGVLSTKLESVSQRLADYVTESRLQRKEFISKMVELQGRSIANCQRLAYMEGRIEAIKTDSPGPIFDIQNLPFGEQ